MGAGGRGTGRARRAWLTLILAGGLFATLAPSAGATVFTNAGAITIPSSGNASPYPSAIEVSGMGTVTDVNVTFHSFSHVNPADVGFVLVGPGVGPGHALVLVTGAGNYEDAVGLTWKFDDSATAFLPNTGVLSSGSWKPTAYFGDDVYPAPGPGTYNVPGPSGAATLATTYNGSDPNGTWSLYGRDFSAQDGGSVAGGWSLEINGAATPPPKTCKKGQVLKHGKCVKKCKKGKKLKHGKCVKQKKHRGRHH